MRASRVLLFVTLLCGCSFERSTDVDLGAAEKQAPPWRPLGPDESLAGKSREEWAIEWMRWVFSETSCDSTAFDPDGSLCQLYQPEDSPVFFMNFAPSKAPRTRCEVPAGRAIVVPIVTGYFDNAGEDVVHPEDEMRDIVAEMITSMRDQLLRVDGHDVEHVTEYAFGPTRYSYEVPAEPNWFSCNGFEGVANMIVEPAYVGGDLAIFPAPPIDKHTLEYGGVVTYDHEDYSFDVTTHFKVVDTEQP